MNITASVGITAVLALTISCASAQVRPAEAEPQASAAAAPSAAEGPDRKAVLAQYAGEYDMNGSIMTIRARGDVLIREMSGQLDEVLKPIGKSETRFRVGTSAVELEFQPDRSGRVTLIMRAGQHEARGVRVRQP
jgi:hypothetical protein